MKLLIVILFFNLITVYSYANENQNIYLNNCINKCFSENIKNNKLILNINFLNAGYNSSKIPNNVDKNRFIFYNVNDVNFSMNPFFALENYFLKNLYIKLGSAKGFISDTFYDANSLGVQYHFINSELLTLYFSYDILSYYKLSHICYNKDDVGITNTSVLKHGYSVGMNLKVYYNFYLLLEYDDFGSFLDNSFSMKGFSTGINYRLSI